MYFSATGTTRRVAQKIAAIEHADLYEIVPEVPYSREDLDFNDRNSRSSREQNDSSIRPAIAGGPVDLSGYDRIFLGYPIWWREEPRIMDTFVESNAFGYASVIPFCTSASSGIGKSAEHLAVRANGGDWLEGRRFGGGVSEEDLRRWMGELR
ncbi:MAG: flavodoxin [Sphaerochaetaceae bacterium]|nr:flavodoxin [Spirochaetales bacterium]MDY5498923.1 flavodoxin [Sphaerochaetaceae bacterium]